MSWEVKGGKSGGGKGKGQPPSFRTAAAAAGIQQRRQQQLQQSMQQQQQMMQPYMQAPPGYALVPVAPQPTVPVFANAAVSNPARTTASFQCKWAGCKAAEQGRPTYGTQHYCFSCCRPKSQAMSPPGDKVATRWSTATAPSGGGVSFPSAVPSMSASAAQSQSPAQKRAAKRQRQRLAKKTTEEQATAKNTGAGQTPAAKAAAALVKVTTEAQKQPERPAGTLTAEIFKDKQAPSKKIVVEQTLRDNLAQLSHLASLVTQSLQGEYLPTVPTTPEQETSAQKAQRLKEAAGSLLDGTLAKEGSTSLTNSQARLKAEAELEATTKALQPLLDAGLPADDQIVKLLSEKKAAQTTALGKLKAGAPSVAAQKVALAVGKQRLLEQQTLLADRITNGKKAARERMNVRDQLMVQITAFIDQLAAAADAADGELTTTHDLMSSQRKETLQRAIELCTERESALEETVFLDADDGTQTSTEQERDQALATAEDQKTMNARLQQQLAQLQQATTAAATQANTQQQQQQLQRQTQQEAQRAAAAVEAQAATDWLADFPAEDSQLPQFSGSPDEQQTTFLLRLLTMKQAAKFASLPRMSFQQLQVEPWFIHRLVGDVVWNACWDDRAPSITADVTVPQKLLNVAIHVAAAVENDLQSKATEEQVAAAKKTIEEQQEAQRKRARVGHE